MGAGRRVTEEYLRTQPLFQQRPGWRRGRAVLLRPRQDRREAPPGGLRSSGSLLRGGAVLSEEALGRPQRSWWKRCVDRSPSILRGGRSGWVSEEGYGVVQLGGLSSWDGGRMLWLVCELSRPAVVRPFSRTSAEMALGSCLPSHLRQHSLRAALPLCRSCGGRPFHQVAQLYGILGLRWELLGKDACFLVELESEKMKAWNSQAHCYHEKAESKTMWNRLEKGIEKLEE